MVKRLCGMPLRKQIETYIFKTISKPRKKLDNLPICPYVKSYKDKINITVTKNYSKSIDQSCQLMHSLGFEAIVIGGKMITYEYLEQICKKYSTKYANKDIEILYMHPDTVNPPLPYSYNFKHAPLVIIQRLSTLQKARNNLKNKTNYYKYHK